MVSLSRAACAGLVLITITGALLLATNVVKPPDSLADQKLWAKLFIVAVLTFNALLLQGIVRPMIRSRIDHRPFVTVFNRFPIASILVSAVSATFCLFAAYLGAAWKLNAEIDAITVITSYVIALLLTWLAGITLCIVVGYCKMHLEFHRDLSIQ